MSIILCGFFCAGKSTLGKQLSEKLSVPFYDTDRLLEARYGKEESVAEIWKREGMSAFRELEYQTILSLKKEPSVVATGGGSLLNEKSRDYLKEVGTLIYLQASIQCLYKRALKMRFPAYLDRMRPYEHFEELALQRFQIYEKNCQYVINTETINQSELWEAIALAKSFKSPHGENPMAKQ